MTVLPHNGILVFKISLWLSLLQPVIWVYCCLSLLQHLLSSWYMQAMNLGTLWGSCSGMVLVLQCKSMYLKHIHKQCKPKPFQGGTRALACATQWICPLHVWKYFLKEKAEILQVLVLFHSDVCPFYFGHIPILTNITFG